MSEVPSIASLHARLERMEFTQKEMLFDRNGEKVTIEAIILDIEEGRFKIKEMGGILRTLEQRVTDLSEFVDHQLSVNRSLLDMLNILIKDRDSPPGA